MGVVSKFITLHESTHNDKGDHVPGAELFLNVDHIQRIDREYLTTQIHIAGDSFQVYESLDEIRCMIGGAAYVRS